MMSTTSAIAIDAGVNAVLDRVLPEARTDVADLGDLERHRERAGAEHEREILCGLQILAAHRDLAARADRALDDRRAAHDETVEHDRHVVLDVLACLVAELRPPSLLSWNSTTVPSVGD